jgi:hypothetical protein
VGRRDELAQLAGLLETARLVTVTGPGGAGMTRISSGQMPRYRRARATRTRTKAATTRFYAGDCHSHPARWSWPTLSKAADGHISPPSRHTGTISRTISQPAGDSHADEGAKAGED